MGRPVIEREEHPAAVSRKKQCVLAVCGVKNSGKTTLIEKLVRRFAALGYSVAVLKHDGHEFSCDVPGTDSYRFWEAGACGTAVFSGSQLFIILGALLLFCDAPFLNQNSSWQILRAGRKNWFWGNMV